MELGAAAAWPSASTAEKTSRSIPDIALSRTAQRMTEFMVHSPSPSTQVRSTHTWMMADTSSSPLISQAITSGEERANLGEIHFTQSNPSANATKQLHILPHDRIALSSSSGSIAN